MVQLGEHLGLAPETRQAFGVGGELGGQDLQGDVAAQLGVLGAEDLAHAAGADLFDDFVMGKLVA